MSFLFKTSASLSSGTNLVKSSNGRDDSTALSSGTSSIKVPETKMFETDNHLEKLKRLRAITNTVLIYTSCGKFSIGNEDFDRLSDRIINPLLRGTVHDKI